MRHLPAANYFEHRKESPITFAGEPQRLTGRVRLRNPTAGRVIIRELRLHGAPSPAIGAAEESAGAAVPVVAVLEPGQRTSAQVRVALDPHTPPGDYDAILRLSGQEYPARLHVLASPTLEIEPDDVVVPNQPGTRVHARVALTNDGNVPLPIGNIGGVVLDEELLTCKTIRATLAAGTNEPRSLQEWVSSYLQTGATLVDSMGALWVDIEQAPLELQPGETVVVDLRVRVPDSLDARSRYRGVAFLYDTQVSISVVPTGDEKRSRRKA